MAAALVLLLVAASTLCTGGRRTLLRPWSALVADIRSLPRDVTAIAPDPQEAGVLEASDLGPARYQVAW